MENIKNYVLSFEYNEGVLDSDNPPLAEDFDPVLTGFEQSCPEDTIEPGVYQESNGIYFSTNNLDSVLPILKDKLNDYGRISMDTITVNEDTDEE